MSYYDNQESVANIYKGLIKRNWNCYGYRADESDSMTDYFSPASWEGIAEKDGYILLVDVYGASKSGYKQTKQGYTPDYSKIEKLKATINDKASSPNEKISSQKIIDSMMNKQKESTIIVQEYPTFKNGNPKGCNWHIEKDGNIIAKGKGAFQCDGYLFGGYEVETMIKVNAFIDRIENHIEDNTQLVAVTKKVVKIVSKPVETKINVEKFVKDQTIIKLNSSFTGGHYKGELLQLIEVRTYNAKTLYTFVKLGKKYQQLKRYGAANNTLQLEGTKLDKWLNDGSILSMELQEVEEVTEKIAYKKAKRDTTQKENLLQGETVEEITATQETTEESTEATTDTLNNEITYQTGTGSKGNGIEITFNSKPSEEVREEMKLNGFRWGGKKRPAIWWAVMDEEKLSLAQALAGEEVSKTEVYEEVEATQEEEITYNSDDTSEPKENKQTENPYNNEVTETPTGFYCHFKSWKYEVDQITNIINFYNINFTETNEKFIFEGVSTRDLEHIKNINKDNESILFDDSYKHDEFIKEIEESKNSYIAEMETENDYNRMEAFDLQFFANAATLQKGDTKEAESVNSLLNKFNNINIENDTRISEIDKKYCENQENMYKEAVQVMQQTLELFKNIYTAYSDTDKRNYKTYIDSHNDIKHIEDRIKKFKNEFISNIIYHFQDAYKVTLDSGEIKQKYKDIDITYQNIVDEIFEQLGGFNFNEKAIKELVDACRNTIYRDDKVVIKKNKLSVSDFIYWNHTWEDKKRLGYNDSKATPLFKGLSHFETQSTDTLNYYNSIYKELYDGEEKHDIFSKYDLGYNKVQTIKFFKNGKIEIEFQTNEQASEFANTYLKS